MRMQLYCAGGAEHASDGLLHIVVHCEQDNPIGAEIK
jgi:hypothetical protein